MTEESDTASLDLDKITFDEISDPAVMNRRPLVSVHMITFNHESYIAQAIEGVLMQETDFPIELVIGEDYSTDRTREVALEYQRKHPDVIRVVLWNRNIGAQRNSQKLYGLLRGKYIAFNEGDDYWACSHKLQRQADFLERNPKFAVCGHWVRNVGANGDLLEKQDLTGKSSPQVFGIEHAFDGPPVHTSSWVLRRSVLLTVLRRDAGLYATLPVPDSALMLMILAQGQGYCFQEFMGAYRIHSQGTWSPRADLTKRVGMLLYDYAIPQLVENLPVTEVRTVIRRGEARVAGALGRCASVSAVLEFMRVSWASSLFPRRRIPAIVIQAVPHIARRLATGPRMLIGKVLHNRRP